MVVAGIWFVFRIQHTPTIKHYAGKCPNGAKNKVYSIHQIPYENKSAVILQSKKMSTEVLHCPPLSAAVLTALIYCVLYFKNLSCHFKASRVVALPQHLTIYTVK